MTEFKKRAIQLRDVWASNGYNEFPVTEVALALKQAFEAGAQKAQSTAHICAAEWQAWMEVPDVFPTPEFLDAVSNLCEVCGVEVKLDD